MVSSTSNVHPSDGQREPIELSELVDMARDVAVIRKRPAWLHDTLQDAEKRAAPNVTFRKVKDLRDS